MSNSNPVTDGHRVHISPNIQPSFICPCPVSHDWINHSCQKKNFFFLGKIHLAWIYLRCIQLSQRQTCLGYILLFCTCYWYAVDRVRDKFASLCHGSRYDRRCCCGKDKMKEPMWKISVLHSMGCPQRISNKLVSSTKSQWVSNNPISQSSNNWKKTLHEQVGFSRQVMKKRQNAASFILIEKLTGIKNIFQQNICRIFAPHSSTFQKGKAALHNCITKKKTTQTTIIKGRCDVNVKI